MSVDKHYPDFVKIVYTDASGQPQEVDATHPVPTTATVPGGATEATLANVSAALGAPTDVTVTGDQNASIAARLRGLLAITNSVWDIGASAWRSTVANGANVAEGSTTDAAVVGDAAGTVSAKLRGINKVLNDVWDSVNHRLKVDGSGVTQPISAAALPLPAGAATETTLAGIKTGTDKIPASPSQEHTTAASPNASRLSDGGAFYDAAKTGQLPSALVSGRLDVNVGNTPTVAGGKTNNNAVPGATNLGTLGAIANAADPSWTEGNQVALSTNLLGHLRACVNGFAAAGASAVGNPVYNGGIDGGGLVRGMLMDTGGRQIVTGGVADGAASAPSTVSPILMGFVDGALAMRIPRTWPSNSDGLVVGNNSLLVTSLQHVFDETNYIRQRGNTDQTVLTSAVRTTIQTVTFTNYNSLYLRVVLDVTAVATSSLVVTIDVQDAISGKWINLLTGAAVSTVSTNTYVVGPGMTAAANLVANNFLGRNLRVVVTPGNSNNTTYSVGRQLSGT